MNARFVERNSQPTGIYIHIAKFTVNLMRQSAIFATESLFKNIIGDFI